MVTDVYYWIYLAAGLLLSFVVPARHRFPFFGLYSFAFMFVLVSSVTPSVTSDGQSGSSWPSVLAEPYHFIYHLLGWTVAFYYLPRLARRDSRLSSFVTVALVVSILGYLGYHKYVPTLLQYVAGASLDADILIPLGVSYFTFKLIHYVIELGRGRLEPHGFSQFFTYIYLFPIYTAGPIERFDHFQRNWTSEDRRQDIVEGLTRILYGLIKKFIVSGILLAALINHNTAETVLIRLDALGAYQVWAFLIVSYLMIYMDFSAYSDIAIGSARLLGFRIMENFNWPILATNISMLWKRWHMTLSGWCQAYVYMPTIGLTRNPYLAIILTFLAVGLWHSGALSWIVWGLYQGVGVIVFVTWTRFKRGRKIVSNRFTQLLAMILTNVWMAGSFAFTITHTDGSISNVTDAFRLLGRCLLLV